MWHVGRMGPLQIRDWDGMVTGVGDYVSCGARSVCPPDRCLWASVARRQVSVSLPAEIPRQRSRFALALPVGEIFPGAKPNAAARVNRSTSSAKNEMARSAA